MARKTASRADAMCSSSIWADAIVYRIAWMLLICRLDRMVGTNARYIEVAATDMNRLAINPVFADPACSLAMKRVAQNGMTPLSRMK